MTHIYLYIECGKSLDDDSRFYYVTIGESQRETRIYTYLESYALEHGHYFVLRDAAAINFLKRCLDSVNGTLSHVRQCSGKELMEYFLNSAPVPYSLTANRQRHELLKKIDPAYFAICQLRKK